MTTRPTTTPGEHEGAVEKDKPGDRPVDNAPGLDDQGMPDDTDKIAQDRIGANMDETQG